jgi:uncharacterized membrane protein
MKRKILVWVGGLLAALIVVGAVGAQVAYADDTTPPVPPAGERGPHDGRGMGQAELEAAAKVLDMTTEELSTALREGKTLEDLATSAGVDLQDVQDAVKAVRGAELRTRIEQAVSDGTMTQEKADWLLEGLDKGFLDGPGFGFGFGRHGGPGRLGQPPSDGTAVTPTANP